MRNERAFPVIAPIGRMVRLHQEAEEINALHPWGLLDSFREAERIARDARLRSENDARIAECDARADAALAEYDAECDRLQIEAARARARFAKEFARLTDLQKEAVGKAISDLYK